MEPQIRTELNRVDALRLAVLADAKREGISPYEMKYVDGTYAMMPLVVARSNLLLALAIYKDSKTKSRTW